ncbi:MAG: SUMF1/EgtB/PvdO family nonheme iron enzyme [Ignavibacteria bacterium]|jgi:hypothetical protein|nr:SUMF1/EgtB/PvdO family nonheme iron enzyme [Ignavibacteria bacterium]
MKKQFNLLTILMLLLVAMLTTISCGSDDDNGGNTPVDPPNDDNTPVITTITPPTCYATDIFNITGSKFGNTQSAYNGVVLLGDSTLKADEIVSWSETLIRAKKYNMPVGTHNVVVKTDSGTSNTGKIVIIPEDEEQPFQITAVLPADCKIGTTLSIGGTQFGATQGDNYVMLGNTKITTTTLWNDNEIRLLVPDLGAAGKYSVSVFKNGVESNKLEINYTIPVLPPQITTMSPQTGYIGDTISLFGSNFGATQSTSYVMVGNVKANVYPQWTAGAVKFVIPALAISGNVRIFVNGIESNSFNLTIESSDYDPVINNLDKSDYQQVSAMRIYGSHFGIQTGKVICTPNLQAEIMDWNDSIIRIVLPSGAKSGELYVERADNKKSNTIPYYIILDDTYPMVLIPRGTFTMGNSTLEAAAPAHTVTINFDFYMSTTPVTEEQYSYITHKNPPYAAKGDNIAAHYIRFVEACEFCNALSDLHLLTRCYTINGNNVTCNFNAEGYRLPTEAEWEYAARAGTTSDYGFTDNLSLHAWYSANSSGGNAPKEVGKLLANAWGLYDMLGNVDEWVWDRYSTTYYQDCASGVINPTGPTGATGNHVIRGGNFQSGADNIKVYSRFAFGETEYQYNIGFRYIRKK